MNNSSDGFRRAVGRLASRIGLGRTMRRDAVSPVTGNICISMVKNEQDIIEPFIRHNAKFFDAMIILDNASQDRTRDILLDLSRELGNVVVCDLPVRQYDQSVFMTNALHHVQGAFFADNVCFLDADEFISCPSRADFDAAVAAIPSGGVGLMPWRTFLPDPAISEQDEPDPLARMIWRRKVENTTYCKVVLRMAGAIDPGLRVEQGNHMVADASGRRLPSVMLSEVPLLHFPVRSSAQLAAKGVIGWLAQQARDPAKVGPTDAYQWRGIHDRYLSGKTEVTPAELAEEAMLYAQTGIVDGFAQGAVQQDHGISTERHFSDGRFGEASQLIAQVREEASPVMPSQGFILPTPPTKANLEPGIENAFEGAWHWDYLFLDMPPVQYLFEKHRPASVLDVGCGNGAYPLLYRFFGASDVLGLDGVEPETTVLGPADYHKVDLQVPFDAGRKFDLVVCLEVIEHVHPDTTRTIMDTIERHAADLILFSMAEPGQPGNGHINCKRISEVLDLWAARGWQPDLSDTLATRALATMSWFRRNLVVLRRTGDTVQGDAARQLRLIGAKSYKWYDQKPGLRLAAFSEAYPEAGRAYR